MLFRSRLTGLITPRRGGLFKISVQGAGVDFSGTPNPATITLTIGNDTASTVVPISRN